MPSTTPASTSTTVAAGVGAPPIAASFPGASAVGGGIGWRSDLFPITLGLYDVPGMARTQGVGYLGSSATPNAPMSAEDVFNSVSTALKAPGATYYVAQGGSDSNAGTSQGAAFRTLKQAQTAANAGGVPTLIYVVAPTGTPQLSRDEAFCRQYGFGTAQLSPTVDTAYVALGGRVKLGTYDVTATYTWAADTTYTNTYSTTLAQVDRIVNLLGWDEFGNYPDLTYIASANGSGAIVNRTPDSWTQDTGTGKLHVNRRDGAAVSTSNTRVYRASSYTFYCNSQVSIYFGDGGIVNSSGVPNTFPAAGFDMEGGCSVGYVSGCIAYSLSAPTSSKLVAVVAKNCTFKYCGGIINTGGRGVSVDSLYGLSYFDRCRADANITDGFNHHNYAGSAFSAMLTMNCTGFDNGRTTATSCNGWTSHETTIGADIAGHYKGNKGGTCRSIDSSKSYFLGTLVENDKGDIILGGAAGLLQPDAFSVLSNAIYYCERTKTLGPAAMNSYATESSTAAIYLKNLWGTGGQTSPVPAGITAGGPGTIAAFT